MSRTPGNPEGQNAGLSEHLEPSLRERFGNELTSKLDTFVQHYRDSAGTETVELALKCFNEAKVQFWRILDVFREKRNGLDIGDILRLLEKDVFLSCVAACSLTISVVSRNFPCDVPLLLKILNLPPYHFLKVMEPVLRADVKPPRQVFTHLCRVEMQIVESLAWTGDSPLWEELRTNGGGLPACHQVTPPSQLEEPQAHNVHPEVHTALVDHTYSVQQNSSPAISKGLQLFARKLYILMGDRLRELCEMLRIPDELRLKIWTCFEYSLVHCTRLMEDRHLDQLLLCAIYIMSKVDNVEMTFSHVISHHCSQPKANINISKSVQISGEDEETQSHGLGILTPDTQSSRHPGKESRGSLNSFYNRIYVPKIGPFAMQFKPLSGVETPVSSPYPRQRRTASHRQRKPSLYNPDTPPSEAASSSTGQRLREINNLLRRHTQPGEEDEDEDEGQPLARRPRLEGEFYLQRRLRDLQSDRMTRRDQN